MVTARFQRLQIRHLLVAVPFFLVAAIAVQDYRDSSFLWHVRAGTAQLDLGRVLTRDPFSYASPDVGWRTQSWLAELGYGSLERVFDSLSWVGVFVFVISAATLVFLGLTIYRLTTSVYATAGWLMLMAWVAAPYIQPRPVVISYVFLVATALALHIGAKTYWVVVPLTWLWSTLHGSWFIGLILIALWWISTRDRRLLLIAGVAALAATLTAHGFGVWEVLFAFARSRGALSVIQEWMPPNFGDIMQAPYLVVIAAIIVASARGAIPLRSLPVVVPFLLFGMTSLRAIYPAALVVIPWAALSWVPPQPRSATRGPVWPSAAVVLALVLVPLFVRQPGLDPEVFPDDEVLAVVGAQPFFHNDVLGGFLIWQRWPDEQVYIDDRAELYGEEAFEEFRRAVLGEYEELFARHGMRVAIGLPDWPLMSVLARDGWREAYRDEHLVVLEDR